MKKYKNIFFNIIEKHSITSVFIIFYKLSVEMKGKEI